MAKPLQIVKFLALQTNQYLAKILTLKSQTKQEKVSRHLTDA